MDGPVTASLDASMRRAVALVAVGWQLVVIWTILVSRPTQPRALLIGAHLALALILLLVVRGRRYLALAAAAVYGVVGYDFYSSPELDSALFLAACWTANTANLAVMLLGRHRSTAVVPVTVMLACGVVLDAVSPIGSLTLTSSLVVTAAAIAVVGAIAVPRLWRLGADADQAADRAQAEAQSAALASAVAREAADDARTLHDTVINTLAAIAVGGAAVDDEELVRERCRHDLAAIGALAGARADSSASLSRIGSGPGEYYGSVEVRRSGLSDEAVATLEAELPEATCRALNGATRELVRNSAKHSGTTEVVVDVQRTRDAVVVTVTDHGRGFDGAPVPGRGLAESVVARVTQVGGRVEVDSAPGHGTRVVVACPIAAGESPSPAGEEALPDPDRLASRIRAQACWLWSVGIVLVGVVIEAANRPGVLSPTYGMLALVALASGLAWNVSRDGNEPPAWLPVFLLACAPVAFLLGMAGAGFGHGDVFHYQAWGITPLLVMLLTLGRSARPFVLGLGALAGTGLVAALIVARHSTAAAAVVVVGAAPAIGLAIAWGVFHGQIGVVLRRTDADRRAALRLRLETAAREAANTVRARWQVAELGTSLELLREIVAGALSPTAPEVRRRCGSEEAYLRQLTQLSPDAFRMAIPLTRALASARVRGVDLVVRTGGVDAPDDESARMLGDIVLDAVGTVPEGSALTVGVFHAESGPQLTMVAPGKRLAQRSESWVLGPESWVLRRHLFAEQTMIEIGWPEAL